MFSTTQIQTLLFFLGAVWMGCHGAPKGRPLVSPAAVAALGGAGCVEPLARLSAAAADVSLPSSRLRRVELLRKQAATEATLGNHDRAGKSLGCARALLGEPDDRESQALLVSVLFLQAEVMSDRHQYDAAVPLYQRALAIQSTLAGADPLVTLGMERGLGDALGGLKRYAEAAALYTAVPQQLGELPPADEATQRRRRGILAATETSFGLLLTEQGLLGEIHRRGALWQRAEALLKSAITHFRELHGPDYAGLVDTHTNLAYLYLLKQRPDDALPHGQRALALSEQYLRRTAPALEEPALMRLLDGLRRNEQNLYSVIATQLEAGAVHPGWLQLAMATALLRKGRSVDILAERSRLARQAPSAAVRALLARLAELRPCLSARALSRDIQPDIAQCNEQSYEALSQEYARTEQQLIATLSGYGPIQRWLPQDPQQLVKEVAAALRQVDEKAALVEIVTYGERDLFTADGEQQFPDYYLALVLFPSGKVEARKLAAAKAIEANVKGYLQAMRFNQPAGQTLRLARELYDQTLKKLAGVLGESRRWLVVPDGALGMIPMHALHDGTSFLVDKFEISNLSSGRDLLRPLYGSPGHQVVLFASPDYGPYCQSASSCDAKQCPGQLCALPGAGREAAAVLRQFPDAVTLFGRAATESALLHSRRPGMLLIATHGMTFDGAGQLSILPAARAGQPRAMVSHVKPQENPLLRTALATAGYNQLNRHPVGGADGLVTALEVLDMDLLGTQLVVLSACMSARGIIQQGQGSYGLHRAFLIDGAETVVTSVESVDDEATSTLMELFFCYLRNGATRSAALRLAQQALLRTDEYRHPGAWAPFVLIGRPEKLRGGLHLSASSSPRACQIP